jgi:hypothetical protein
LYSKIINGLRIYEYKLCEDTNHHEKRTGQNGVAQIERLSRDEETVGEVQHMERADGQDLVVIGNLYENIILRKINTDPHKIVFDKIRTSPESVEILRNVIP